MKRQRRGAALQLQMVLALTLVLALDLAQITKLPLLHYLCSLLMALGKARGV